VVHCLAGKGRTGTIIASYLLYAGLFHNAEKALEYFAIKRSNNNWGVTGPSQLRYVTYLQDIIYGNITPSLKGLQLTYIHISSTPSFFNSIGTYALGRQGGCCPLIHIYNVSKGKKLIYSSENENEELKSYPSNQSVTFQIDCLVKGDILVEVYHVTPFYRTEHMLRFNFYTGMVRNAVLRLARPELDLAAQDKRFSASFFLDLGFEPLKRKEETVEEEKWWANAPIGNGSICFFNQARLLEAKEKSSNLKSKVEKAGWLTKRGHTVKNWKRRWFVLRDPTLAYYKSPRDNTPAGVIIVDDILTILSEKNIYEDNVKSSDKLPSNWFEIITKKTNYVICGESELEVNDWVDAIEFVISQRDELNKRPSSKRSSELQMDLGSYPLNSSNRDQGINASNHLVIQEVNQDEDTLTKKTVDDMLDSVCEIEENLKTSDEKTQMNGHSLPLSDFFLVNSSRSNSNELLSQEFVVMENPSSVTKIVE